MDLVVNLIFSKKGRLLGALQRGKTVDGMTIFRVKEAGPPGRYTPEMPPAAAATCNQRLHLWSLSAASAASLQQKLSQELNLSSSLAPDPPALFDEGHPSAHPWSN